MGGILLGHTNPALLPPISSPPVQMNPVLTQKAAPEMGKPPLWVPLSLAHAHVSGTWGLRTPALPPLRSDVPSLPVLNWGSVSPVSPSGG